MTPFTTVKIRTAAAVICDQQVALIRRVKDGVEQYTMPGGNVEPGEDLLDGLRRELAEELGLDLDVDVQPGLLAVQDQMVTRPGPTPPPRKLHLIFRVPVASGQCAAIAMVEHDDLSDGAIVWMPLVEAAGVHLFPAVGGLLAGLDPQQPSSAVLLPALNDRTFRWR